MNSTNGCLASIVDGVEAAERRNRSEDALVKAARDRRTEAADAHSVWLLHGSQSANEKALCDHRSLLQQHQSTQSYAKLRTLRQLFEQKNKTGKALQKEIDYEKKKEKKLANDLDIGLENICERFRSMKLYNSEIFWMTKIQMLNKNCNTLDKLKTSERQKQQMNENELLAVSNTEEQAENIVFSEKRNSGQVEVKDEDQTFIQKVLHQAQLENDSHLFITTHQLEELQLEICTLNL